MIARLCFALIGASLLGAWMLARAPAVIACSADYGFDRVAASEVIVGGRIERYVVRSDVPPRGQFRSVELVMTVTHVWKGEFGPADTVIDNASYMPAPTDTDPNNILWIGGAGACGAFDHDPTGKYAVFGLTRESDGTLRTNRLRTFYLGTKPYDPANLRGLADPATLSSTGTGNRNARDGTALVGAATLAIIGLVGVCAGAAMRTQQR